MAVVVSMILPALQLSWFTFESESSQTIYLFKIIQGNGYDDVMVSDSSTLNWQQLLLYATALISFVSLVVLCFRIRRIYLLKKKFPVQPSAEFDFVNTNISSAPFSFLKNIFWRNDISLSNETGRQILQHEIVHIKQKHSWDKIFMQLIMCFYWMNPFYYLIKKELYLIHEFIADEKAVKQSDANAFAKMLLTTQFGKFDFLPAQSIFYSSIKRRLIMLTSSKTPQFNYLRRILVLPLTAVVICLFAFTVKNKNNNVAIEKAMSSKPFVLVVDAGHGGKDGGAFGNDLQEKDLTLKIANKIKELSSKYGIDVILTRSGDTYMSPQEKADFTNAQNANAFISIHVNAADNQLSNLSGFEVVLSRKNTTLLSSNQVLGSAILQSLSTDFKTQSALEQKQVGIWVLDQSKIPSALVECGYLSNKDDAKMLHDNSKIELMAQHILQGVAMYANNKFDKNKVYQIQTSSIKDTSSPTVIRINDAARIDSSKHPLFILNGKEISETEMKDIDPNSIESINVLKDESATKLYGSKGKYGVVEIKLKAGEHNSFSTKSDTLSLTNLKPVFTTAQQQPQFPGGNDGWKTFLENNLDASLPAKNKAPKGIYTVTVSFLVDENGKVSDVKAVNDPGYGTAAEAVRVIAKGPNWVPAVQNNQKVVFEEKQNISFSVD